VTSPVLFSASRSGFAGLATPREAGCQTPFSLTYKARLLTRSAEDRAGLHGFLEAYRRTSQQIAAFLVKWFCGSIEERTAASLLICPQHLRPEVLESEAWQTVATGETTGLLPAKWLHLTEHTLYQNLRALAGPGERATKSGTVVREIWAKFNLPHPTAAEFDRLFGIFPAEAWRTEAANAVQGALRSYFSLNELARREDLAREARRAVLSAQAPGFFGWLPRYLEDARAFAQACRLLHPVRQELLAENVDRTVLRACQSAALLKRLDARALWPRLPDPAMDALALAHPAIVARISRALPSALPPIVNSEPDSIRRFCSAGRPVEFLAREPGLVNALLRAIQREWHCFTAGEFDVLLNEVGPRGPHHYHWGWSRLCRSNLPRDRQVLALAGAAREYARLLRPVRQAGFNPEAEFTPLLPFGQRFGWDYVPRPERLPANTAAVAFDLPDYSFSLDGAVIAGAKRKITVLLRGHLPGNGAEMLETPLAVKAGPWQFRPDRRKAVFGQHPRAARRQVFLKPQALRLLEDRRGFAGAWTTLHMAETPVPVSRDNPLQAALKPGQRLGVLIVLPGGSVLCDLLVFERTDQGHGWKPLVIEETRPRTDAGMPHGSKHGQPQPWICKRRPFVRIDSASIDLRLEDLMTGGADLASPAGTLNRETSAWKGCVRTALCDTGYKQCAARLERLLSWNRCDGVLIAGGGFLRGQSRLQHPFKRFYNPGTRSGYLINALNRLGLPWTATTARAARIWMKEYLDHPEAVSELHPGHVFRRLRRGEIAATAASGTTAITSKGSVTHIARTPDPSGAVDFPINAGWAVILAWADPDFNRLVAKALAMSQSHSVDGGFTGELRGMERWSALPSKR
jgi:hypothetical protein